MLASDQTVPVLQNPPSAPRETGLSWRCSTSSSCTAADSAAPSQGTPALARLTFHVHAKVVAHFVQNEVDIFFCGYGMGRDVGRAVCGPCNRHLLPRQEENHSAVTGGWVEQTHVIRAEIKEGRGSEAVRHPQGSVPAPPVAQIKYQNITFVLRSNDLKRKRNKKINQRFHM